MAIEWIAPLVALGGVAAYDVLQRKHAVLRNFPIIGHFRYGLERVGPELRQYIVSANDEERPFTRDQRRWVYASAKRENNLFSFGTDNKFETSGSGYIILKHAMFPVIDKVPREESGYAIPCIKVVGGPRGRKHAFRPPSIINISAMSFGALSSAAVTALNRGAKLAGCLHNTGEGGISPYHEEGADLIYQLGTGYFGSRNADGTFSLEKLVENTHRYKIRTVEFKLSQGAKPGLGGMLPASKVTPEVAAIRGVPVGKSVESPAGHSLFRNTDELLDQVERVADATGLPVGIKSAVGNLKFWEDLADQMVSGRRGVDYIQIDGGEGGTGASPLVFTDHVSLPFRHGFPRVYRIFSERGIADRVVWIGSGRLGFPMTALLALGMGCDMVSIAREAMLSIGCIQAQKCHTGRCPTGVTSQVPWLVRGLDPSLKSVRFASYVMTLRRELLELAYASGVSHPALIGLDSFEILDDAQSSRPASAVFGLDPAGSMPPIALRQEIEAIMAAGGVVAG